MCLLGERRWVLVGSRNGGSNAAPPFPLSKHSFFSLSHTQTHTYTVRALKIPGLKIAGGEASARLLLLRARPARPYQGRGLD